MDRRNRNKTARRREKGQKRIEDFVQPRRSERNKNTSFKLIEGTKKAKLETGEIVVDLGTDQVIRLENEAKRKPVVRRASAEKNKSSKKVKLSENEQLDLLRNFDITLNYGPCRGISRRERYLRALKFNLEPVPDKIILEILDDHGNDDKFEHCIWDQNQLLKLHW
ncbi:unnamed protein product [Orchesella dallaii]|uniref:DNA polymerase delta subunit 4 n=1 Tax=Orchesella dallaii TaxID=48710 RepID=A0ABP1R088_9HEXA